MLLGSQGIDQLVMLAMGSVTVAGPPVSGVHVTAWLSGARARVPFFFL